MAKYDKKYDKKPDIDLDQNGNGHITLFRDGYKIIYDVKSWGKMMSFSSYGSGRYDGGIDGAHEVPQMLVGDGYKYVRVLARKDLESKKARLTV